MRPASIEQSHFFLGRFNADSMCWGMALYNARPHPTNIPFLMSSRASEKFGGLPPPHTASLKSSEVNTPDGRNQTWDTWHPKAKFHQQQKLGEDSEILQLARPIHFIGIIQGRNFYLHHGCAEQVAWTSESQIYRYDQIRRYTLMNAYRLHIFHHWFVNSLMRSVRIKPQIESDFFGSYYLAWRQKPCTQLTNQAGAWVCVGLPAMETQKNIICSFQIRP